MFRGKKHWYLLTFMAAQPGGGFRVASVANGAKERYLTTSRVAYAKEHLDMPANSVLINSEYIGTETPQEHPHDND